MVTVKNPTNYKPLPLINTLKKISEECIEVKLSKFLKIFSTRSSISPGRSHQLKNISTYLMEHCLYYILGLKSFLLVSIRLGKV